MCLLATGPLTTTLPGAGGGGGLRNRKCIFGKGGCGGCGGGGGNLICAWATVNVHAVITAINNTLIVFIIFVRFLCLSL